MRFLPPTGHDQLHIGLTSGHSTIVYRLNPEDGKPGTPIQQRYRKEAIARGCEIEGMEDEEEVSEEPTDHHQLIIQAIEAIIQADQPESFDENGRPLIEVVKKQAGFNITKREYDAAWVDFEESLNQPDGDGGA
ncbi:hypothetical protein SB18R_03290 [Pseudomonas oryzihabitans]|nr:hypothetical protein SB9_12525 [Pseudomonas psychrotolerans]KTT78268.1 hypothetical protein SB18R_03290 [Pseudomonas psychrotolerans]